MNEGKPLLIYPIARFIRQKTGKLKKKETSQDEKTEDEKKDINDSERKPVTCENEKADTIVNVNELA